MRSLRISAILVAALLAPLARADTSANLDAKLTTAGIAGVPILLELTITPTGDPFSYWSAGDPYPEAGQFSATLTDSKGQVQTPHISNDAMIEGTGFRKKIDHPVTCPLVFDPLAPGQYTLTITSPETRADNMITWPAMKLAKPLTFTVVQDVVARRDAEQTLLAKAPGDSFSQHVAYVYGLDPIIPSQLKTLLSPDQKTAFQAVGNLQRLRRLPPGGAAVLLQAAQVHVKDPLIPDNKDLAPDLRMLVGHNLLNYLALIASHVGEGDGLEPILVIARAKIGDASANALSHLANFPHSKNIENALLPFATDADPGMRWAAMRVLDEYRNPIVIPFMLDMLASTKPEYGYNRVIAAESLSHFMEHADVRARLREALTDTDPRIRTIAEDVLKNPP